MANQLGFLKASLTTDAVYLGSLSYSFDDHYYVRLLTEQMALLNSEKTKKFAPFYSAGIGWNIHNENS